MMKRLLAAVLFGVASWAGLAAPASAGSSQPGSQAVTVVELFTSQGCSSCPPADELLGELAGRSDIIALTLPVDYWDYLGWKDTLASPWHTRRQKQYAQVLRARGIYTPQIVVNGRMDAVGSRRREVEKTIRNTKPADGVNVAIVRTAEGVFAELSSRANVRAGTKIWFVQIDSEERVSIGRGENTGRTITYYNVARKWDALGTYAGGDVRVAIPRDLLRNDVDGCVVMVQEDGKGAILGASYMAISPGS